MNKEAKMQLLHVFYAEKLHARLSFNDIATLQRVARVLQNNAEHCCNGVIDTDQWDKIVNRSLVKLSKIFMSTELSPDSIEIQGDPRGYVLKITNKLTGNTVSPEHFN